MKKLLIVTYYWPPSGGSGVQRWLNLSNYLVGLGWDVTVMVPKNPSYPLIDSTMITSVNTRVKILKKVPIFEQLSLKCFKKTNRDHVNSSGVFQKIILWIRANLFSRLKNVLD